MKKAWAFVREMIEDEELSAVDAEFLGSSFGYYYRQNFDNTDLDKPSPVCFFH